MPFQPILSRLAVTPEELAAAQQGDGDALAALVRGVLWRRSATGTTAAHFVNWNGFAWIQDLGLFVGVSATGTGTRCITSPDGLSWTLRNTPADNSWNGVAFGSNANIPGRGLLVAVASSGAQRVMTSPDGINWTLRNAADNTFQWWKVAFGKGVFVAISQSGAQRVMTSTNGTAWTLRSSADDAVVWASLTFANGRFVAVGGNSVMYSDDGITWQLGTIPVSGATYSSVAYGNGVWVAVAGGGGFISYSTDNAATFTSVTAGHFPGMAFQAVAFGDGMFVTTASNGTMVASSKDGRTWSGYTYGTGFDVRGGFGFNGTRWVAMGNAASPTNLLTSPP